jgi:ATP-dependent DNA helicase RecQ
VTWRQRPSPFLAELGVAKFAPERASAEPEPGNPVYAALKRWRLKRAKADGVPAYVVFHNSTLAEVAARRPKTLNELASVPGVGPTKLERYGEEVLAALAVA